MKKNAVSTIILFCCVLLFTACQPKADAVMDDALLRSGGEYWERLTINERPVGFQHTSLANEEIEGRPVKRWEQHSRLIVLRYGKRVDVSMKVDSLSESGGAFLSCRVEMPGDGETIETKCRVEKGKLIVEGASSGNGGNSWTENMPGPEAVPLALLAEPMKPEQRRNLSFFEPALQRRVDVTLLAEKIEEIEFNGTKRKLLRIRAEHLVDGAKTGQTRLETLWTDAAGNVLRHESPMGDGQTLLAVRTDRDGAMAGIESETGNASGLGVELGNLGVVPLNRALAEPEAKRLEFLVKMSQGKPTDRFPVTPFQNVESLKDGKTAKITVWSAVGEEEPGNIALGGKKSKAKPEDLASSRLIDFEDPKLVELAATVDTTDLTPWQTATALERLVHDTIQKADFSTAFASSKEVLQRRSGDCTEYAVLLAALCRFQKIPCRVTLGLVYTPLAPSDDSNAAEAGMAFHLWNEVLVDGVWRPLDATLAQGGADAARIKIADDSLAGDSPAAVAGAVLDVLGRLQLNVGE